MHGSNGAPGSATLAQRCFARAIIPLGLATPLLVPFIFWESPAAAFVTMAASHLPLFYGTFLANRQSFGPVATHFAGAPDEVCLTIDDGPDAEDTPRILDLLEAAHARAIFFVRGDRARAHPKLIEEIARRGHTLGNHTYNHPQGMFWALSRQQIEEQMRLCNTVLQRITGQTPRWFRAPVGMVNPYVHRAAAAHGMRVVGWSARGYDGVAASAQPETVVAKIGRTLRPGGIVLMHEGRRGPHGESLNTRALDLLLHVLAALHWRAVVPSDAALRCS